MTPSTDDPTDPARRFAWQPGELAPVAPTAPARPARRRHAQRFAWQPGELTPVTPPQTKTAATWNRGGLLLHTEAKTGFGALPNWNEANHPRDAHGRFIEIGARVRVFGGGDGTVRGNLGGGKIDVELDNGQRRAVHRGWLTVTARPDGTAPTSNPQHAQPAPPHTPATPPTAHTPDVPAGSGSPVFPPPDPTGPELTPGQATAAKYWKTLPTGTIAELQQQLAAAKPADVPTVAALIDSGLDPEAAVTAHKKAAKAAYMKSYDLRLKLQAALDTAKARDQHLPDPLAGGPDTPPAPAPFAADAVHSDLNAAPPGEFDLPTGTPVALYDPPPAGPTGPGGHPNQTWYDRMRTVPDGKAIPVSGLTVGGRRVESGWAVGHGDVAYLVERRGNETPAQALTRLNAHIDAVGGVVTHVPAHHRGALRGAALLDGPNPADAGTHPPLHTELSSDAYGGLIAWNGTPPKPTQIAHEYGRLLDTWLHYPGSPFSTATEKLKVDQPHRWTDAGTLDRNLGPGWVGRFTETRLAPYADPITVGGTSVTATGAADPQADFAESVRLWLKDRREGKIGFDPTTGDNVRFSDVFPNRAATLNHIFGVDPDGAEAAGTPARKRRVAAAEQDFYGQLAAGADLNQPGGALTTTAAKHGLPGSVAYQALITATLRWDTDQLAAAAKANAEQALAEIRAEAAAKAEADRALAEARAADRAADLAKITSIEQARDQGLLDASALDTLRRRRRDALTRAHAKGLTGADADAYAAAWEAGAVRKWLKDHPTAGLADTQPWKTAATSHHTDYDRQKKRTDPWADQHVISGGDGVHPLAEKQNNLRAQAKANIAAELAARLNNPDDWAHYREYMLTDRNIDTGSYDDPGPATEQQAVWGFKPHELGSMEPEQIRQRMLDRNVSQVVAQWAANSGDSDQASVRTQIAAAEEFGLDAHPAPTMESNHFAETIKSMQGRREFLRRVLRVQYDHTQEQFAKHGVSHVTLYRGMTFSKYATMTQPDWAQDGVQTPKFQPINSFSSRWEEARSFGPTIFHAKVPVERVMGSAATGFGCFTEWEYVVLDGPGTVHVVNTTYSTF